MRSQPARHQRVDPLGDRRPAVAHRMVDDHLRPERAGERLGLARGDRGERRAFVGPDLPIGMGRFPRPGGEDDAAQDRLPDQLRDFDDAADRRGTRRDSAAPRPAPGASGVPRLTSSTPILAHPRAADHDRQGAHPLAGQREIGVGDGRRGGRHGELGDAARRLVALEQFDRDVGRVAQDRQAVGADRLRGRAGRGRCRAACPSPPRCRGSARPRSAA